MRNRPSLPALIALAILVDSYCWVATSAASPAVEDELRGGAGGRTMRRRAASVMVPITILKSAVYSGAGMHAYICFSFFNSFPLPQSCIDST